MFWKGRRDEEEAMKVAKKKKKKKKKTERKVGESRGETETFLSIFFVARRGMTWLPRRRG